MPTQYLALTDFHERHEQESAANISALLGPTPDIWSDKNTQFFFL